MASRKNLPAGFSERVVALKNDGLPYESAKDVSILSTLRSEYGESYPFGASILPLRRIVNEARSEAERAYRIAPTNVARIAAERDKGVGIEALVARTGLAPSEIRAILSENATTGAAGRVYAKRDGTTRLLLGSTADGLVDPTVDETGDDAGEENAE